MTKPEPRRGVVERDVRSCSNPYDVRVYHFDLELEVGFTQRSLSRSVTLSIDQVRPEAETLVRDTRDLAIQLSIQEVENITGDDDHLR